MWTNENNWEQVSSKENSFLLVKYSACFYWNMSVRSLHSGVGIVVNKQLLIPLWIFLAFHSPTMKPLLCYSSNSYVPPRPTLPSITFRILPLLSDSSHSCFHCLLSHLCPWPDVGWFVCHSLSSHLPGWSLRGLLCDLFLTGGTSFFAVIHLLAFSFISKTSCSPFLLWKDLPIFAY